MPPVPEISEGSAHAQRFSSFQQAIEASRLKLANAKVGRKAPRILHGEIDQIKRSMS